MAIRKDGIDTRDKILKAASEVFAKEGYRNTTVADICRRAGSNVAAVNYHFGSKDALYVIVWRNAFEEALRAYPPDGGLPPDAPAEQCLHALVHSALHRILGAGRLGHAGRILIREMSDPSEAIRGVFRDVVRPLRERTRKIIKRLLGPNANDREIGFCEMSVLHQCLAMGFRRGKLPPGVIKGGGKPTPELIDALAEHITKFSLAGIQAVRENINNNHT
ncbi:MAG: CerR family C-terminal domain-containing protein [Sedimentisphaerales bacterium]|nr:CerR family C-terminal domain-containing protein [Sedimentisphaerales bacterium]